MIPAISAKSGLSDFTPVLVGRVVHPPHTHPHTVLAVLRLLPNYWGFEVRTILMFLSDVQKLKSFHFLNHVVVKVAILPGFEPGPSFLEDKHDDQNTTHAGLPTEICFLFLIGKE